MPTISTLGTLHPIIVQFVVVLLLAGVGFRLISLTGRFKFTDPAAIVLLLAGAVAAYIAVMSGTAAHGPVERIPGLNGPVNDHEEWGERTRDVFLIVGALELIGLAAWKRSWRKGVLVLSLLVGLVGCWVLYETGLRGGRIVYAYGGGVAIRMQDTTDVGHLLANALYQRALLDRSEGDTTAAAAAIAEMANRFPRDADVQLLHAQSLMSDAKDPAGALSVLAAIAAPPQNRGFEFRSGMLRADAFQALGQPDSARAALNRLIQAAAGNTRLQDRLKQRLQQVK
jgi:uncharacterized membrane protein